MGKRKVFSVCAMGGYADATACTRNFSVPELLLPGISTPTLSWLLPHGAIFRTPTRTRPSCAKSSRKPSHLSTPRRCCCCGGAAPPWRANRAPHSIACIWMLDRAMLCSHILFTQRAQCTQTALTFRPHSSLAAPHGHTTRKQTMHVKATLLNHMNLPLNARPGTRVTD